MRKRIVAGNWKMNNNISEAENFISELKPLVSDSKIEIIICAPYIDLQTLVKLTGESNVKIGAQNMHFEESGAFTGEISGSMLKSIGVEYVIVGHSERRQYFAETDETVNKKIKAALKNELKPIFCIGETLEDRELGITARVVNFQTENGLKGITPEEVKNIIIAYEPIWAIGTGKTASNDDANDTIKVIREKIEELYGKEVASSVIMQYGGSVKGSNAKELFEMSDIDGALVGGASLDPIDFSKIVNS